MDPTENKDGLYINPIFDKKQKWIWTADKKFASRAWGVSFDNGVCYLGDLGGTFFYVRAVR